MWTMTSYRAVQNDLMVGPALGGCVEISGGDYCPPHFRNGNAPQVQHDAGLPRLSSGTPAVPKMGVRARIKDWPPRRELSKESLLSSPLHEADQGSQCVQDLSPRSRNAQSPSGDPSSGGFRGLQRIPRRCSKDVEFQDGYPRSPGKRFAPLWNRSNSEITLSEHDTESPKPARGTKHMATGMPLFREYGSTSSIDVQGISEQSFFEMLNEFRQELPDQRSAAPDKLHELLRADTSAGNSSLNLSSTASKTDLRNGQPKEEARPLQKTERTRKKSGKSDGSGSTDSSIFRKLLSRGETDTPGKAGFDQEEGRIQEPACKPWVCPKSFAHYDVQSILFDVLQVAANRDTVAQRKNTTTGASAASAISLAVTRALGLGGLEPTFMSTEDLNYKENLEPDLGDCQSNDLLLSCPHFRNEIGGAGERNVSFLKSSGGFSRGSDGGFIEPSLNMRCTNASISVLEIPSELQSCRLERLKHYSIEHVDMGAQYYQDYFHNKEHFNYFGTDEKLGPVAISIKREKLEDTKEHKDQYQYRLIFRTSELLTLRGALLEDAVPSTTKHGTVRGLPLKDVLEYVIPELSTPCLRLALGTPKVTEQLLKLDEQGLSKKHKVGILFCKAAQSTEEEMYNNEEASPGFEDFLSLLGEKVCLKGFPKYAAQLDTKTDSTGTHSLYTSYQDYEIMFHVSTMLPYTPNNRQQLLRKRHIGNDIVTIIFQEPGALPFTPQNIRSHFQHVFVIVRVHSPCTENVCYSVAVTRSKDVPPFGPPIPCGVTFRSSEVFRDFLLAKVINAENAAHKSEKFHTMATRTRQEYLKDLAENCVSNTPIDSTGKFNLISLTSKKKEKTRARESAELGSLAAITWRVSSQDFSCAEEIDCTLGISNEFVVLIDQDTKEVVFNCFCGDVIGWTPDRLAIKIFYGRGDHIFIRVPEDRAEEIKEVVQRLKVMTTGCETVDMTLRRNGLGQLGFHVKFDGTVAEVEEYGFAWQAGLRQGSRLVEICKVAVVTLTHDQMIDLLRTSVTVKVVIIPPLDDGAPRRGFCDEYEMKTMEQKPELESLPAGYRVAYHSPAWQWSSPSSQNALQPQRWVSPGRPQQPMGRPQKPWAPIPYREPQPVQNKRPVSFPETPYSNTSPGGGDRGQPYRNPSGSFSTPGSGAGAPLTRYKQSADRYGTPQRPVIGYDQHVSHEVMSSGDSSSGFTSQESTMERTKPEPLWHVPPPSRVPGVSSAPKRANRQEMPAKDSPNRHFRGEAQYSSHSSSNTLSSNASSSHSDERWFHSGDPVEADQDPMAKGGSSDSGIDASTLYTPSPNSTGVKPGRPLPTAHQRDQPQKPIPASATYSGLQEHAIRAAERDKRRESSPAIGISPQVKGYRTQAHALPGTSSTPAPTTSQGFKQARVGFTPQGYKTPVLDKPKPTKGSQSGSHQLSTSIPKSFYSKNKHVTGWKKSEDALAQPSTFTDHKKQVEVNSKNVFGQPRLRASLRDLRSPRKTYKSTIEDDLKKLIVMDCPGSDQDRDMSQRKPLQRTFSDESICSGRRDPSYASAQLFDPPLPSDFLFTSTLPSRRQHQPQVVASLPEKKLNISASELSLTEVRDKTPLRRPDPGMMPLPDTASGLEWSSLVNAAKAYEVQRTVSLFSLNDPSLECEVRSSLSPVHTLVSPERSATPRITPPISEEIPGDLKVRLYQLEVMLKQLHSDLEKEKQDKVVLLTEVSNLRENNQRLQKESVSANEQLKKFSHIYSSSMERK
ncbi:signal-induced proliferation-associated 1-like protein 3 isoform X1 [Polyodon spathula]|uniref:signal-induced proliferation-associated 1-like protein 3 isoform X1 n=1 Tax=Polyodon spathula TaxID=7913 RepID=UPI001B7E70F4|nr:signal-induced proliferation-associated 1-like protein 3 isoform X1 [Polyodon spathula]XP_041090531.1 signal-induced proliferation-associated 1-like protein 3 isoform X1 [Polyodon spathula]